MKSHVIYLYENLPEDAWDETSVAHSKRQKETRLKIIEGVRKRDLSGPKDSAGRKEERKEGARDIKPFDFLSLHLRVTQSILHFKLKVVQATRSFLISKKSCQAFTNFRQQAFS